MGVTRTLYRTRRNIARKARLFGDYVAANRAARRSPPFDDLKCFCLFVGYPRCGSSLLGSLIDAHPDAVIAHEANALKAVRYGFGRDALRQYLLRNSARFTAAGRVYTGYSYAVPGQWQGRHRTLRVIGDKFGDFAIEQITRKPELVDALAERVDLPIRYVHPVRNPFDNITTIFKKRDHCPLAECIDYYFDLAEGVLQLKQKVGDDAVYDHDHEAFIADTEGALARLCEFLGLPREPEYLAAAAGIVFKSPRQTRHSIDWPTDMIDRVRERSERYPFLAGKCDAF